MRNAVFSPTPLPLAADVDRCRLESGCARLSWSTISTSAAFAGHASRPHQRIGPAPYSPLYRRHSPLYRRRCLLFGALAALAVPSGTTAAVVTASGPCAALI
jgi:hypothetical protein